jgi:hypothetical protein
MFMHICLLRHEGSYGIVSKVINVPVDVSCMVQSLPCRLSYDYAFNVKIKNLIHKSVYLGGYVCRRVICQRLNHLVKLMLYKLYSIKIEMSALDQNEPVASTSMVNDKETVSEQIDVNCCIYFIYCNKYVLKLEQK